MIKKQFIIINIIINTRVHSNMIYEKSIYMYSLYTI